MEQLARLYARGRIFKYTQANLNSDQGRDRDYFARLIYEDPEIKGHKKNFSDQLAAIIKGDYRDIPGAGAHDAYLAIHKAVLSHTYHTPLQVRCFDNRTVLNGKKMGGLCTLKDEDVIEIGDIAIWVSEELPIPPAHTIHICAESGTSSYTTNPRGLLCNPNDCTKFALYRDDKLIKSNLSPGPTSNRLVFYGDFNAEAGDIIKITDGPDIGSEAQIEEARSDSMRLERPHPLVLGSNYKAMKKEYERFCDEHSALHGTPEYVIIKGLKPAHLIFRSRVPNIGAMFDKIQRKKIGKQFIWGYFSQIIRENKQTTIKVVKPIQNEAHIVAMFELKALFAATKIPHEIQMEESPTVLIDTNMLPADLANNVGAIKREYLKYSVDIQTIPGYGIDVKAMSADMPIISKRIMDTEYPIEISRDADYGDDGDGNISDILQYESVQQEFNDFEHMLSRDVMDTLRKKIPEKAKEILDIWRNDNQKYAQQFGDKAVKKYIVKFLGIKPKEYDTLKFVIGHHLATLVRIDEDDE